MEDAPSPPSASTAGPDPTVFAFGPNGRFLYQVHDGTIWSNLPSLANRLLDIKLAVRINWATFGSSPNSYFLSYITSTGDCGFVVGSSMPFALTEWLEEYQSVRYTSRERQQVRVVLGYNDAYVFWTTSGSMLKWENIPEGLDIALQGWRTAQGWTEGPPRFIALGRSNAYIAMPETGEVVHNFPKRFRALQSAWSELMRHDDFIPENILYASLAAGYVDKFIIIEKGSTTPYGRYMFSTSQGIRNIRYLMSEEPARDHTSPSVPSFSAEVRWATAKKAYTACEPGEISLRPGEYILVKRQSSRFWWYGENSSYESGYFPVKHVNIYRVPGGAVEKERTVPAVPSSKLYTDWKTKVDAVLAQGNIMTFPSLPKEACICNRAECALAKRNPDGVGACQHDVKRLFERSGWYSASWLKKESMQWHPDRFARKCAESHKNLLSKQGESLFVMLRRLQEEEQRKNAT